jgi:hypothetical protein
MDDLKSVTKQLNEEHGKEFPLGLFISISDKCFVPIEARKRSDKTIIIKMGQLIAVTGFPDSNAVRRAFAHHFVLLVKTVVEQNDRTNTFIRSAYLV